MATSGTYSFSMDIDEVIQEAMEMIGGEPTLGEEPRSARRSINLLLQDWQNRGIQLWTINTTAVSVATSVTAYSLDAHNIDVIEAVVNRDNTDLQLERISMEEYLKIPRKGQTGRPTQYAVRRERDNPVVYLWPVPENNTDKVKFETVKYFQDVSRSSQTADLSPFLSLPYCRYGILYVHEATRCRYGQNPNVEDGVRRKAGTSARGR
jgi:hypothetical protein